MIECLDGGKEGLEQSRVINVRGVGTDVLVDLRQCRATQAVTALAEVDQQQGGIAAIGTQLRGQGTAHITHRCKRRHDQRQRSRYRTVCTILLPDSLHRHGILTNRNGDTQRGTQLGTNRAHGVIQNGILTGVTGGRHPVGRQGDPPDVIYSTRGDIGQCLAHGHAPGGRPIQQRHRGALANGHGLTGVTGVIRQRHGHVSDRHLPGTHHLVAHHHTSDGTIANSDKKGLVGHGRQLQHTLHGITHIQPGRVEVDMVNLGTYDLTLHLRRLAQ